MKGNKENNKKIIVYVFLIAIILYVFYTLYLLIKQPTNVFTIEEGKLYQEETNIGYVIRTEQVVRGENYKNGMMKIITEGERASKDENIFRYYSSNEENLKKKIKDLDNKIQEVMINDTSLFSSDMKLLENQIDEKVEDINQLTDVAKLVEYKKEINNLVTKKAQIAGNLSPKGSYLNQLIEERKGYESLYKAFKNMDWQKQEYVESNEKIAKEAFILYSLLAKEKVIKYFKLWCRICKSTNKWNCIL